MFRLKTIIAETLEPKMKKRRRDRIELVILETKLPVTLNVRLYVTFDTNDMRIVIIVSQI